MVRSNSRLKAWPIVRLNLRFQLSHLIIFLASQLHLSFCAHFRRSQTFTEHFRIISIINRFGSVQLIRLVAHHQIQIALVWVNTASLFLQLLIKIADTLVSLTWSQLVIESTVSLSSDSRSSVNSRCSYPSKYQVWWNDDGSASHTSMTVD